MGVRRPWESFRWPDETVTRSFTILTTAPNAETSEPHNRMPVIFLSGGLAGAARLATWTVGHRPTSAARWTCGDERPAQAYTSTAPARRSRLDLCRW